MGGDVYDARDAILAAANLLAANGGRTNERAALRHYNLSPLYWTLCCISHTASRRCRARSASTTPGGSTCAGLSRPATNDSRFVCSARPAPPLSSPTRTATGQASAGAFGSPPARPAYLVRRDRRFLPHAQSTSN